MAAIYNYVTDLVGDDLKITSQIVMKNETIRSLRDLVAHGKINLQPPYQRKQGVWDLEKRQKLIDSIMRGFPIGEFRFTKEPSHKETDCNDALQRYTSIDWFMKNEFPWEYEPRKEQWFFSKKPKDFRGRRGWTVKILPEEVQNDFGSKGLNCIYMDGVSGPVATEIFDRNQEGLSLQPGEQLLSLCRDSVWGEFINTLYVEYERDILEFLVKGKGSKKEMRAVPAQICAQALACCADIDIKTLGNHSSRLYDLFKNHTGELTEEIKAATRQALTTHCKYGRQFYGKFVGVTRAWFVNFTISRIGDTDKIVKTYYKVWKKVVEASGGKCTHLYPKHFITVADYLDKINADDISTDESDTESVIQHDAITFEDDEEIYPDTVPIKEEHNREAERTIVSKKRKID